MIEVLKQALEKIANVNAMDYEYQRWAREALAIAKLESQEPVAWEQFHGHMAGPFYQEPPQREWVWLKDEEIWSLITRIGSGNSDVNPLTILADVRAVEFRIHMKNSDVKQEPQRTWVGLTDEERIALFEEHGHRTGALVVCKAIEAKLKERNNA
jgi:hypothetical protein